MASPQGKPAESTNNTAAAAAAEEVDPAVAEEEAKRTVFVGNLPYNTSDEELKTVFSAAGNVYVIHPLR